MSKESRTDDTRVGTDTNRRRHFRTACEIEVTYRVEGREEPGSATLVNLGLGGARVDLPEELPMPTDLTLTVPGQGDPVSVRGRVIWTVLDEDGGPIPTGLQFQNLDDETRRQLFDLIEHLDD